MIEQWNSRDGFPQAWLEFLSSWKDEVREKLLSSYSPGTVNRTAANHITTDEFPKNEVLHAYLDPVVFDAQDLKHISDNLWKSKLDISKLARACLNKFKWSTESKILKAFENLVWPGAVMRLLLKTIQETDDKVLLNSMMLLLSHILCRFRENYHLKLCL